MADSGALARLAAEVEDDRRQAVALSIRLEGYLETLASSRCTPEVAGFVAVLLHRWYSALEAAFERIERTLVGPVPVASTWHRELLRLMALGVPGHRDAILSASTVDALLPYLQFRHFLRHAYAVELDPARLHALVAGIASVQARLDTELEAFVAALSA